MVGESGGSLADGSAEGVAEELPDPLLGRNVGRKFVLDKLLGAGAMGAVYRARQTALEKTVAIKVMHGELARDPMFAARFHREAKAASRLDHANSIRILDYGQDDDGLLYIAMEFLDGRDLAHLIVQDWPLTNARIVDLMSQALSAIAVAHDMGITHRDLKPENIMVLQRRTDEGLDIDVVKVCDFGIAKLADPAADNVRGDAGTVTAGAGKGSLTTAGLVIGTPAYMSPEQGRGEVIDGRSDLYSMGVILYQLLTGQLPFDAPSAIGLVVKHQTEVPPPPSTLRSGVDPRLEAVCLKALQKRSADRYQTARDLRADLRAAVDGSAGPLSRELPGRLSGAAFDSHPSSLALAPQSAPEVAHARTELQLAAVPTGVPAVLAARSVEGTTPGGRSSRARWPMVAGVVVVAAVAGAVGWKTHGRGADGSGTPAPTSAPAAAPPPVAHAAPHPDPTVDHDTPHEPRVVAAPDTMPSLRTEERSSASHRALMPTGMAASLSRGSGSVAASDTSSAKPGSASSPTPDPSKADPSTPGGSLGSAPAVASAAIPAQLPTAPPPVAPPPAASPFAVESATIDIGSAINLQQMGATKVNVAFGHIKSAVVQCYKDALPTLAGPIEGAGTLHIETDDSGNISVATLSGPVGGRAKTCIERSVKGTHVSDADTGSAAADVPLTFKAR
jgi:serine/threonine protein kinase